MSSKRSTNAQRPVGTRPLKVGASVRQALAQILQRGEVHDLDLAKHIITISEVKMSPDLSHAHVFVTALGGLNNEGMLKDLRRCQPLLRSAVAKVIKMRYAPELHFQLDTSFDYAQTIGQVFVADPVVAKDLGHQPRKIADDEAED